MQAPLNPLADIGRRLVQELHGEEIADMAGYFGTPEAIVDLCKAAGFDEIEVKELHLLHLNCLAIVTCSGMCKGPGQRLLQLHVSGPCSAFHYIYGCPSRNLLAVLQSLSKCFCDYGCVQGLCQPSGGCRRDCLFCVHCKRHHAQAMNAEMMVQITHTEEQKLCTDTTPEQYAEQVLSTMATFPVKPLGQLLSTEQLQELKALYMPEAVPMVERMRTKRGDIDVRFTIQWVVARC